MNNVPCTSAQAQAVDQEYIYNLRKVVKRLEAIISNNVSKSFGCELLVFPWDLLREIASTLMDLSQDEYGGLSTCWLYIQYQIGEKLYSVSKQKWDPEGEAKYIICITLKKEHSSRLYTFFPHWINTFLRVGKVRISSEVTARKMLIQEYNPQFDCCRF